MWLVASWYAVYSARIVKCQQGILFKLTTPKMGVDNWEYRLYSKQVVLLSIRKQLKRTLEDEYHINL